MSENKSGYVPLGRAVLVKPYEEKKEESLIVIPDSVQERRMMVEQRALVIECGPLHVSGEDEPRCKPGDRVMISRMAGFFLSGNDTLDGAEYRVVNHQDIFLRIES